MRRSSSYKYCANVFDFYSRPGCASICARAEHKPHKTVPQDYLSAHSHVSRGTLGRVTKAFGLATRSIGVVAYPRYQIDDPYREGISPC
jgi:hypothetical protein